MHWSDRLNARLKEIGWQQKELSEASGLNYDQVNKYMRGEIDNPRGKTMARIAAAIGRTEVWLRYGIEGDLVTNQAKDETLAVATKHIPVISFIQAGKLASVADPYELGDGIELVAIDLDTGPRAFALKVEGESMLPRFRSGEVIICDPDASFKPGDFVIAKVEAENAATLKKYRPRGMTDDGIELFDLVPLNEDYPTISATPERPIRIIGKVVRRIERF